MAKLCFPGECDEFTSGFPELSALFPGDMQPRVSDHCRLSVNIRNLAVLCQVKEIASGADCYQPFLPRSTIVDSLSMRRTYL